MTDISERQEHVRSHDLHEHELINRTCSRSKLNNVINLYRKASEGKHTRHVGVTQCLVPNDADKLIALSEDFRKEIIEDMQDWETYMYCKENEERKNFVEVNDPIRNCSGRDNVIKTYSQSYQQDAHNTYNGNSKREHDSEELSCNGNIYENDGEITGGENKERAKEEKALGNMCFAKTRYVEACTHYTKSLNLYPNKEAFNNRAIAYMKLKNFTAALKDANEVLKMDPTNEKALYRRITCHKEMRMYEEALRDLKGKSMNKKFFSDLWNTIQNEIAKLNGKKYMIRPQNGSSKAFEIDISQLSAYANCEDERYVLEVDRTGCTRSCVCGYCTEEDQRSKTKSSGLRIKDRHRWKLLTNALLNEMRITSRTTSDISKNECDDRISYKAANDNACGVTRRIENEKPINQISSKTNLVHYVRPTNFKNMNDSINEVSSRKNYSNIAGDDWSVVKKLLDDVRFVGRQPQENVDINGFDVNEKLIAILKTVEPSSLKTIFDSHLDGQCLAILFRCLSESFFQPKEWSQIYNILEAAVNVEQFHEMVKCVDEKTKNRLFLLLDKAIHSNLRNAACIKRKISSGIRGVL